VIWFYDHQNAGGGFPFPIKLLENGNILINVWFFEGLPVLREVDLAGNTIWEITTPEINSRLAEGGFDLQIDSIHHDVTPLGNGHLMLLTNHTRDFTDLPGLPGTTSVLADSLVDLDEDLNPVWVWNAFDHLDINRQPRQFPDWTHGNAVTYSPDDGNLLISMRRKNWVIKVDYQDGLGTGEVIWRLGHQGDFALPGGGPADWFYAQHFPFFLGPDSTNIFQLAIYDNGNDRVLDDTGTICGADGTPPCYTRAVIYEVNEVARTVQVVWEGKQEEFTFAGGSIQVLENGDVEFTMSTPNTGPRVLEVTRDVAPETVWQLGVTGQGLYRALRIPSLYPGVQW
jgi:hypothetical protein